MLGLDDDFRYVVRIVQCGSITAIGRNLCISKSTVCHRLQQLEVELKVHQSSGGLIGTSSIGASRHARY
jgi:hypothetical protein